MTYWAQQYANAGMPRDLKAISRTYASDARLRSLIDVFGESQESRDLYPGNNDEFITAIYRNLFNREPDAAGKAFWIDTLDRGAMTRAIAAVSLAAGAQSTDQDLISYKVEVADSFTSSLSTDVRRPAYDGMAANIVAREGLGKVTLAMEFFQRLDYGRKLADQIVALSSPVEPDNAVPYELIDLTFSSADGPPGSTEWYSYPGLIAPGSNNVYPIFKESFLVQSVIPEMTWSNGVASKSSPHSVIGWNFKGMLTRHNLIGTATSRPGFVTVSTLTRPELCPGPPQLSAFDYVAPLRGWSIFAKPGADNTCGTSDDSYLGVRYDMLPGDAPLRVSQPLIQINANNGALSGFLVRDGNVVSRVDTRFANPVALFTLPVAEMIPSQQYWYASRPPVAVFKSGDAVYAWNVASTLPGTPTRLASAASGDVIHVVEPDNSGEVFVVIANEADGGTWRIVSYAIASKAVRVFPTVAVSYFRGIRFTSSHMILLKGIGSSASAMTISRSTGELRDLPVLPSPGKSPFEIKSIYVAGERVWLAGIGSDSIVTMNIDGSDQQRLDNTQLVHCLADQSAHPLPNDCKYMVLIVHDSLRSYNTVTGTTIVHGEVILAPDTRPYWDTVDAYPNGASRRVLMRRYARDGVFGMDLYGFDPERPGLSIIKVRYGW